MTRTHATARRGIAAVLAFTLALTLALAWASPARAEDPTPVDEPVPASTATPEPETAQAESPAEVAPAPVESTPTPQPEPEVTTTSPTPTPEPSVPPTTEPTAEPPATPDTGSLGEPMTPFAAGPEPTGQQFIAWTVSDPAGQPVGGATFTISRRVPPAGWTVIGTVTDCVAAPCTSRDRDPDPGEFQLIGGVGNTPAMAGDQLWRIEQLDTYRWFYGGTLWHWGSTVLPLAMQDPSDWVGDPPRYDFGVVEAVQRGYLTLQKSVAGRWNPADQFRIIIADAAGAELGSARTTGTSTTGIRAAVGTQVVNGQALRVSETMAAGSSSTLEDYTSELSCVDNASNPVPVGDGGTVTMPASGNPAVTCTITNTPANVAAHRGTLIVQKVVTARVAAADQFRVAVAADGGTEIAAAQTTGTGTTATATVRVNADSTYTVTPTMPAGTTPPESYLTTLTCETDTGSTVPVTNGTITTPAGPFTVTCTATTTPTVPKLIVVRSRTIADPASVAGSVVSNIGADTRYTDGARYRLYTADGSTATSPGAPGTPLDADWATCTVTGGAGECTITVPPESLGPRYWIVQEAAAAGTYINPAVRVGTRADPTQLLHLVGSTATATTETVWLPKTNTGVTGGTPLSVGDYSSSSTPVRTGSFGAAANSIHNPPVPDAQCLVGLRVALVVDESTSITPQQWLSLGDALVGADNDSGVLAALRESGGQLSVLRFGTNARWMLGAANPVDVASDWPAVVTAVRAPKAPDSQYTNWQYALRTVAAVNATADFDMVLFVTDGAPNYILAGVGVGTSQSATDTTLRSIEAPVYAANALKAAGVRVVGVGVGYGYGENDGTRMDQNLRAISGDRYGTDFVHGEWADVEDLLATALGMDQCRLPALTIEKSAVTPGPYTAGQPVTWEYTVRNTAWPTVEGITVTDDRGVTVTCPKTTLQKGEQMVCTGTGPLTRSHP